MKRCDKRDDFCICDILMPGSFSGNAHLKLSISKDNNSYTVKPV